MKNVLLFAPFFAFLTGMSAAYGLFAPDPNPLLSFLYIIPLGISVRLVVDALRKNGSDNG